MSWSLGKCVFYKEINDDNLSNKENLLPDGSVVVGFGTTKSLRKSKTVQSPEDPNFRKEVRNFMVRLIEKLREQPPFKYSLPFYLESLSPSIISTYKTELHINRFKKPLECLHESGWIDPAKSEYKAFVYDQAIVTRLPTFDIHSDRIDVILGKLMQSGAHLLEAVNLCLILSHGNAHVGSGFLTNEQILDHNMKETSLVAQHIVFEGIQS